MRRLWLWPPVATPSCGKELRAPAFAGEPLRAGNERVLRLDLVPRRAAASGAGVRQPGPGERRLHQARSEQQVNTAGSGATSGRRGSATASRRADSGPHSRLFARSMAFALNGRARLLLCPPEGGLQTTRQASLDAADRLVAPPRGLLTLGLDPTRSRPSRQPPRRAATSTGGQAAEPLKRLHTPANHLLEGDQALLGGEAEQLGAPRRRSRKVSVNPRTAPPIQKTCTAR
jgi:hypothetical protein